MNIKTFIAYFDNGICELSRIIESFSEIGANAQAKRMAKNNDWTFISIKEIK